MATVRVESTGRNAPGARSRPHASRVWPSCELGMPTGPLTWPATDVYETPDAFLVRLEVAGLNRNELSLGYMDDRLLIAGKRCECCTHRKRAVVQMEIPYGTFQRMIELPVPIKLDQAEAHYADGFLEILIPKAKRTPRRKIYITVNW